LVEHISFQPVASFRGLKASHVTYKQWALQPLVNKSPLKSKPQDTSSSIYAARQFIRLLKLKPTAPPRTLLTLPKLLSKNPFGYSIATREKVSLDSHNTFII